MPRLSDSMEEGTILKWLKSDGDEVSKGEELVEIETDKANMTYEADESGTLEIVAQEGDTLPVGETIARIGEGGGGSRRRGRTRRPSPRPRTSRTRQPEDESRTRTSGEDEPARSRTPRSRGRDGARAGAGRREEAPASRRARAGDGARQGLADRAPDGARDRASTSSAHRGHRPGRADRQGRHRGRREGRHAEGARAAARSPKARRPRRSRQASRAGGETGRGDVSQELTRLQRTVARRMAESKATAPDFVMTLEVDMEEAVELRAQLKAAAGDEPAPSFNDFVIKAAALALRDFPRANGAYRDGQFELYSRVNVGVAVAGPGRARRPDRLRRRPQSLGAIAAEARRARRARARGQDHAARALRRHLHGLEPRHVRHPPLRGGHQPAAGRDPGRRRALAAARRPRRRGRRPRPDGAHAHLRPPDPLRRRRRRVPGRSASTSSTRSGSSSRRDPAKRLARRGG